MALRASTKDAVQQAMERNQHSANNSPATKIGQWHTEVDAFFVIAIDLPQKPARATQRHRINDDIDEDEKHHREHEHCWCSAQGFGINDLYITAAAPQRSA